jgi:p-aminobenzoyl-glutamate transporter AbgT
MDSDVPVGPSPSISDAADSVRRWIASLVLYVELRIKLLALESKEAGVHLLLLAVLFVSALVLFASFLAMLIVFLLYLLILDLPLGMGLERIGLCRGVAHYQYHCGDNISASDHQTALPNDLCRI